MSTEPARSAADLRPSSRFRSSSRDTSRARSRAARARAASIFGCLIVRLHVSAQEARRRAATRTAYITYAEFTHLHDQDPDDPPPADHDVTDLTIDEQVAAVTALWRKSS